MSQTLESRLAAHLRELLVQTQTGSEVSPELSISLQDDLAYCIPQLLREPYPEWEGEYLDVVLLTSGRKLATNAAELYGWAILLINPDPLLFPADPGSGSGRAAHLRSVRWRHRVWTPRHCPALRNGTPDRDAPGPGGADFVVSREPQ